MFKAQRVGTEAKRGTEKPSRIMKEIPPWLVLECLFSFVP
jgi:hypothetical protein